MTLEIRSYQPSDEAAVVRLWHACGLVVPWNDPHRDIQRKLAVQPELFLVGCVDGKLVATAMMGYEGHRGWINYLAVAPEHQRQGVGERLIREAERRLRALGCPKINVLVRSSNAAVLAFYETLGFTPDEAVCLGKRLIPDA